MNVPHFRPFLRARVKHAATLLLPVAGAAALLSAAPAHAHLGHIGEVAGHDHILALAAGAAAAALAALAAYRAARDKRSKSAADAPDETADETGDAAAPETT